MLEKIILLVEDSRDDEELILRSLKTLHIKNKVIVAHDGVEAIDYIFGTGLYSERNISEMPSLVLLDLKLPKIDGLEVLRRIRTNETTKHLPVAILTSSELDEDRVAGYGLGANSYVRKPVGFEDFSEAVRQLGLYWLMINEDALAKR